MFPKGLWASMGKGGGRCDASQPQAVFSAACHLSWGCMCWGQSSEARDKGPGPAGVRSLSQAAGPQCGAVVPTGRLRLLGWQMWNESGLQHPGSVLIQDKWGREPLASKVHLQTLSRVGHQR